MKKEKIKELLTYSKSKDLFKLVLLCNDEILTEEIIYILKKLSVSNRSETEKYNLVKIYIDNRNLEHIKDLITNNLILKTYSYSKQVEIIKNFIDQNRSYENILKKCYIQSKKNKK